MSGTEPKKEPTAEKPASAGAKTAEAAKKKGFTNPALRMMGIPRLKLPSRNWMIFWSVLAGIGGGIAYDKYQQSQIRKKWMAEVHSLSERVYPVDRVPRKLTIFIAPPPDDFLEESLKIFRKFVKPVLNAASLDYEVFSESRQGDIRSTVAQKIRQLRLDKLAEGKKSDESESETTDENNKKSWTSIASGATSVFKGTQRNEAESEDGPLVKRSDLYKPADVLGLYHLVNPVEVKSEDELNPAEAGGVICIGRGAYKEYLAGVHEGLLGPLEKPQEVIDEEERVKAEKQKEKEEKIAEGKSVDDDEEEESKLAPVVKPFIQPSAYSAAELAPELNFGSVITNEKNVPVLFEQPVYVYPIPKLTGFLKIPEKIYRYFTKRRLADEYGRRTTSIVYNLSRPFQFKDTLLAKEEELNWPKKWVEKGKTKNAEWIQELEVDERITERMRVYDPELLKKHGENGNESQ
ncbi:mitochondrial import inner membrane translocase subunit Tim54 [Scheffersomyces xylosifermentans]|uniref:mitochondrial import inner membrane translocase subunit Tim54 n=1 Tax=Scheffersomyces xylosifermentans TaxID=1304137 RepID=UPI00315D545E